jgi:hypothetical protein
MPGALRRAFFMRGTILSEKTESGASFARPKGRKALFREESI